MFLEGMEGKEWTGGNSFLHFILDDTRRKKDRRENGGANVFMEECHPRLWEQMEASGL